MRISRLELDGIGPFEQAVFEIPPPPEGTTGELVLFEGPNGCGKTTIVQAISSFGGSDELIQRLHDQGELAEDIGPPISQFVQRFRSDGEAIVRIEHGADWWRTYGFKPGRVGPWNGTPGPAFPASARRGWAAFAYKGHLPTPVIATKGPAEIDAPPLRGALSFGAVEPASAHFGQLLVNLDQEVAKAFREAHRDGLPSDRRLELERLAASRQRMLDEIARAISEVLGRKVTFEVPIGHHAPTVLVDREPIPLDLLGEGMRSTLSWLADLLVRLHRIPWANTACSPLEQDFWLILDEIDESLHPALQRRILPTLRNLFPNARIYATTHSPFVVASVGEGYVFPIRPDKKTHLVTGETKPKELLPGQSLSWIVEEIFDTPSMFLDEETQAGLAAHERDVKALRTKKSIDWEPFLKNRRWLMGLNDEVATIVGMREVPVQDVIRREQEQRQP
jgi:AAA domain, putative AbiEii toxin, Type IV TA system/AAA domain